MNLKVLKKSRHRPELGEVFAMLPPTGGYLFGRVIATGLTVGGFPGANLVYVYRARSERKEIVPPLSRSDLLIPPHFVNGLGWTRGYFECLCVDPLGVDDVLPRHSFLSGTTGTYFDERGVALDGPIEPVGFWGLGNHSTLDDLISRALGIPLSSGS